MGRQFYEQEYRMALNKRRDGLSVDVGRKEENMASLGYRGVDFFLNNKKKRMPISKRVITQNNEECRRSLNKLGERGECIPLLEE